MQVMCASPREMPCEFGKITPEPRCAHPRLQPALEKLTTPAADRRPRALEGARTRLGALASAPALSESPCAMELPKGPAGCQRSQARVNRRLQLCFAL